MIKKHKRFNEEVEKNIFKIALDCSRDVVFRHLSFIDKFLYILVNIMINYDIQHNVGKFKVGDTVKYNWKAKVILGHVYKQNSNTQWVIDHFYCNGENWSGKNPEDSSSVFWVKKVK